ncbi:MAG: MerC domain-containing protein [Aestuariibacter sp.]
MKTAQSITDKFAIGLSLMCAVHCLLVPILLVFLPSLAILQLDSEQFHLWLVVAVIPSSVFALTLGCKQHKRYQLLGMGAIGLILLILALLLGEKRIGETGEKTLTVLGSACVAIGHWINYRLCRVKDNQHCPCPNDNKQPE